MSSLPNPLANCATSDKCSFSSRYVIHFRTNLDPDLGASHHVTLDPSNLASKQCYNGPNKLFIGNGKVLSIFGIGSTCFFQTILNKIP